MRAFGVLRPLGFALGIDYSIAGNDPDLIVSFMRSFRRGGLFGLGGTFRLNYLPTRNHNVTLGYQIPLGGTWMGRTRPRSDRVKLFEPAENPPSPQPAEDAAVLMHAFSCSGSVKYWAPPSDREPAIDQLAAKMRDCPTPYGRLMHPQNRSHHGHTSLRDGLKWLGSRKPELGIFLLGVALRVSMRVSYPVDWAYDFHLHWQLVEWMILNRRVAPADTMLQAQHPPGFYTLAGLLTAGGVPLADMAWLPILCGVLRLALIWVGLELFLPKSRWARCAGLTLAATLGSSVHIDGMVYPEGLNCLLNTGALLLAALILRRAASARWRMTLALGVLLGVAMLVKVSTVVIIGAIGLVVGLEFLLSGENWKTRSWNAARWAGMLAVCVSLCGWYYARNVRDFGKPFVVSFDLPSQQAHLAKVKGVPYLFRRPVGFFLSWDPVIYLSPYAHSTTGLYPTFFPTLVASTFVDYWGYGFCGAFGPRVPPRVLRASQRAAMGGTVIFGATVLAWFAVVGPVFRRRDWGSLVLLAAPLVALASAIHYAIAYPLDQFGQVKGVYVQFASAPLYGVFGLAVAWAQERRRRWPLLALLLASLWMIATYTVYCRFRLPILPLG